MAKKKYVPHPACLVWPRPKETVDALAKDIAENGLRIPIDLAHDKTTVIDGFTRYLACEEVGVRPKFRVLKRMSEADTVDYIISVNQHRRHMDKGALGIIGAKLATMKEGGQAGNQNAAQNDSVLLRSRFDEKPHSNAPNAVSAESVARNLGISTSQIEKARTVVRADPALAEEVVAGTKSLPEAVREVKARTVKVDVKDRHGHVIPQSLVELWLRSAEIRSLQSKLRAVIEAIEAGCVNKDPLFAYVHQQQIVGDLNLAIQHLTHASWYSLCPVCGGDKCKNCRELGIVNKHAYDNTPKTLRAKGDE